MSVLLGLLLIAAGTSAPSDPAPRRPLETVPANGVDEPPRRGTFVESSLGVFTTLNGSAGLSNGQPYLSMTVGQEVGDRAALFGTLGIGASSASCFVTSESNGNCDAADSFGAAFVEAGASFGLGIALRTLLSVKAVGGLSYLSPGPVCLLARPSDCLGGNGVPDHLFGFHFGGGLSLDYDTHLDHFAVGLDALVRRTIASYTPANGSSQSLGITSLAVMPRIRYVF